MPEKRRSSFALSLVFALGVVPPSWAAGEASGELDIVVEEYFEEVLRMNPVFATSLGDDRYDDRLSIGISSGYRAEQGALNRRYLARIEAIDRSALEGQDRLSYDILKRDLSRSIEGERFPGYLQPISQMGSLANFFAQLGSGKSLHPFKTVKNYDDFLSRIDDFEIWSAQAVVNLRQGGRAGIVQPRVVMEKVLPQLAAHVVADLEESLFLSPISAFPEEFGAEDKERLEAAYREAIQEQLIPSYRQLHDFIRDEHLPLTRESVGRTALPDGEAWYAFAVAGHTTTDLKPDAIHQIGLAEVSRIRGEMGQVKEQVGFEGDLAAFFVHLQEAPEFYFEHEDDLIAGYVELQKTVNERLPRLFDVMPKADYEVRPVEKFRAKSAAGASYMSPSPDGSRPGVFYVNTFDLKAQPRYGMETLSIHEASPGHHFQISIQQEIESLPRFRRFGGYTAYVEGWALYAESIGKELGMFSDPYQYYGRLSDEMLRAMRLVVDTGLHAKGWTRERAIDFMKENSSMARTDIVAEVERYIAIPGQALAYKIGQRKISELRKRAEEKLGEGFDVKEFHNQILLDGALPLDVLDTKIDEWIVAATRE